MSVTPPEPTGPESSSPGGGLPRRRNGKQQSCEPCRIAKAACDHSLPKCNRCVRKGISAKCTYHPAPMTKKSSPSAVSKSVEVRSSRKTSINSTAASNLLLQLSEQLSPDSTTTQTPSIQSSLSAAEPQYLGSTSYTAVFQENQDSLGEDWDQSPSVFRMPEVTGWDLSASIDVLKTIPDRDTCTRLLDCHHDVHDGPLHEPTINFCLESLWETYGDALSDRSNDNKLQEMSRVLLKQTYTPVKTAKSAAEWLQSYTGECMRFEVIGTLLAVFAIAAYSLPARHDLFRTISPRELAHRFGKAAEWCQDLSSNVATVNEFTLYLNYHLQIIQSMYRGDDSGFFWRKSGTTATTITALGFNWEHTVVCNTPFMVSEIRKRMFVASFIIDKQVTTLIGRPPRLSRRYANVKLPLDLSDSEIMLKDEELQQKISMLDSNGWNTHGRVSRSACIRAMTIAAISRDEILELSFGSHYLSEPKQLFQAARNKSKAAFDSLPPQLRYHAGMDLSALKPVQISSIITIKLEFLMNEYLLDRIGTENGGPEDKQPLVDTAQEILDIVVLFEGLHNPAGGLFVGSTRLLIYFGVPSAGLLAIELLKQHKFPKRHGIKLNRAKVIRNLSVFAHFLRNVPSDHGNYVICSRVNKVISRILDQILEDPPMASSSSSTTKRLGGGAGGEEVCASCAMQSRSTLEMTPVEPEDGDEGAGPLPPLEIDVPAVMGPVDDLEFMSWLENQTWDVGPWSNVF